MWETLHLYSRYAKNYSVSSTSSVENTVSAYTTVNGSADSMTVIIVNRDMNAPRNVTVSINGFSAGNGTCTTLELSALPSTETFKSHTDNALKKNIIMVISNSFIITVPALSTTAVILSKAPTGISEFNNGNSEIKVYPNPAKDKITVSLIPAISGQNEITVYDIMGRKILNSIEDCNVNSSLFFDISILERGIYFLSVKTKHDTFIRKFSVIK
jgi:hypothetical protein